jgi:hypothetical protein
VVAERGYHSLRESGAVDFRTAEGAPGGQGTEPTG